MNAASCSNCGVGMDPADQFCGTCGAARRGLDPGQPADADPADRPATVVSVPAWVGADWGIAFPWALATVLTALGGMLLVDAVSIAALAADGAQVSDALRAPLGRVAATIGGVHGAAIESTGIVVLVLAVLAGRRAVLGALGRLPFTWARLVSLTTRVGLLSSVLALTVQRVVAHDARAELLAGTVSGDTAWGRGLVVGTLLVAVIAMGAVIVHVPGHGPSERLGLVPGAVRSVRRASIGTVLGAAGAVAVVNGLDAADGAVGVAAATGVLTALGDVLRHLVDVGAAALVDALPPLGDAAVLSDRGGLLDTAVPWWLRLLVTAAAVGLLVRAARTLPTHRAPRPVPTTAQAGLASGAVGLVLALAALPALLAAGAGPGRVVVTVVLAVLVGVATDVASRLRQQDIRIQVRD